MRKFRALSCLILALCLLFYALPRLPVSGFSDMATGFSLIWTLFAIVVVGSNLLYTLRAEGRDRVRVQSRPRKLDKVYQEEAVSKKRRVSIDL